MCHFPPGTSKWNAIEHRLFAHITMNWRGRPLTSHEVVVASIAATATRTGLSVRAELDTDAYPTGVQVSDETLAAVPITRHRFHGDWNYTLHPAPGRQDCHRSGHRTPPEIRRHPAPAATGRPARSRTDRHDPPPAGRHDRHPDTRAGSAARADPVHPARQPGPA